QGFLKRAKVRHTIRIERAHFAIDHAVGKARRISRDLRELLGPVEALTRAQTRLPILDAKLQTVAIEFRFVHPARARGWRFNQPRQLRLGELRHGFALQRRAGFRAVRLVRRDDDVRGIFFFTPRAAATLAAPWLNAFALRLECQTRPRLLAAISSSVRPLL